MDETLPLERTLPYGHPEAEAVLLREGERVVVTRDETVIGRDPSCDVPLASERASRRHARVVHAGDRYLLEDLGSKNGTYLNGTLVEGQCPLASGDAIEVGRVEIRFVQGGATKLATRQVAVRGTQAMQLHGDRMTIGRDASNDLVLANPNVSRVHAELRRAGGRVEIHDMGSVNGTFVDGERVRRAPMRPGAEVHIGPYRLVYDGVGVVARDEQGRMRLVARDVGVRAGDKEILTPTTLTVRPGEFVAIIGESGAGKSTLIKALAGVSRPTSGTVAINGDDVSLHARSIGYVPQEEIVHRKLRLEEAFRYSARLRLPPDTSSTETDRTVEEVLRELDLVEHRETLVDLLSGGQRRRAGVGVELLSRPSLLFLDEPTTGLDPGLEARMMEMLRKLADDSRGVLIVTHATQSLGMCDRAVVMGRGGVLCFDGSPDEAVRFFGADSHPGIYASLASRPPAEWRAAWRGTDAGPAADDDGPVHARGARAGAPPRASTPRSDHTRILASRYARLMLRDRRNLLILLGQVPLIGLALVGLFKPEVFSARGDPSDTAQLLFLLVTVGIWLGSIDSAREIIKERSVFVRETAVGVSTRSYLVSKLLVLLTLGAVQVSALAAIVFAFRPLHAAPGTYAAVIAALVLTCFISIAMGLVVSALVNSQDQAVSFVPLVLIPQLFFAGAIISVEKMSAPIEAISHFIFAKWAFALVGGLGDMQEAIEAFPEGPVAKSYGGSFFDSSTVAGFAVLAVFLATFTGATAWLLSRRSTTA